MLHNLLIDRRSSVPRGLLAGVAAGGSNELFLQDSCDTDERLRYSRRDGERPPAYCYDPDPQNQSDSPAFIVKADLDSYEDHDVAGKPVALAAVLISWSMHSEFSSRLHTR